MAPSTVSLLGTLRELHGVLPRYDWRRLEEMVAEKQPDLLCVEIDRQGWESSDLEMAPIESSQVLARLTQASEITLVPIGGGGRLWSESGLTAPRRGALAPARHWLFRVLDGMTAGLMRLAGEPRAINSAPVEHLCGALCELQVMLVDEGVRRAWAAKNQELLDGILWVLRRDPGRRVLVALDCRRKHWLRQRLRSAPEATVVDFSVF